MDMKRLKKNMWDLLTDRHEKVTMAEVSAGEARHLPRPEGGSMPCR